MVSLRALIDGARKSTLSGEDAPVEARSTEPSSADDQPVNGTVSKESASEAPSDPVAG